MINTPFSYLLRLFSPATVTGFAVLINDFCVISVLFFEPDRNAWFRTGGNRLICHRATVQ
jgi:hypothetical protein